MSKLKNKTSLYFKSTKIPFIGLISFISIIGLLTAIFNWFWTGTGDDPTRSFYSSFTTNFNDFKDYATLYIALLSFGATMFAGFAVFLVFNDWREQHNQTIITDEAKKLLIGVDKDVLYLASLISNLKRFNRNDNIHSIYDELLGDSIKKFNENLDQNDDQGFLVSELADNKKFDFIRERYSKSTMSIQIFTNTNIKKDSSVGVILDKLESTRKNYLLLNKIYKGRIKKLIFA